MRDNTAIWCGRAFGADLALDSLMLQDGAESVLGSTPSPSSNVIHDDRHPAITTAVAGLTMIQHLTVRRHCDRHSCGLVKTMRSPLKTASLQFAPLSRGLGVDASTTLSVEIPSSL